jgi:hypothetical protein
MNRSVSVGSAVAGRMLLVGVGLDVTVDESPDNRGRGRGFALVPLIP